MQPKQSKKLISKYKNGISFIGVVLFIFLAVAGSYFLFTPNQKNADPYKTVAYVTPWNWSGKPDADKLTHVIYCFAKIDTQTHLMSVPQDKYLKELLTMRTQNPDLKIMLSLGGGGADGFSQAAQTQQAREIFANECLRLINEYSLDGIDIDWETPVTGNGKIQALPEDKENCTLLVRAIREKIGPDKLISFAVGTTGSYISCVELDKLNESVNFFNVMSYCFSVGAKGCHDANLFASPNAAMGGKLSVDSGLKRLKAAGIPSKKLIMGVPFFAYDEKKAINQTGLKNRLQSGEYTEMWDDEAKAPYLVKKDGTKLSVTFDNARSIACKADYIKSNGFGGIMCWELGQDDNNKALLKAVWESLNGNAVSE